MMNRNCYSDELSPTQITLYRTQLKNSIQGLHGQNFLQDLHNALQNLPSRQLISSSLQDQNHVCSIGALARSRKLDTTLLIDLEPYDLAHHLNTTWQIIAEIIYTNDELAPPNPHQRWSFMLRWTQNLILPNLQNALISSDITTIIRILKSSPQKRRSILSFLKKSPNPIIQSALNNAMPTYTFQEIFLSFSKSGICPSCGKRAKRSQRFSQTINPFNKNSEGQIKSREEIYAELHQRGKSWMQTPTFHAKCEP